MTVGKGLCARRSVILVSVENKKSPLRLERAVGEIPKCRQTTAIFLTMSLNVTNKYKYICLK
ncbi:hypothetical protein PHAMO_10225 [Magnetospirillum molischianum DSM 120]|uniref:Uncharacterized protein n=1 Tax=Magnetospirillum molischianum DSM 120 TaxID=1150626 RepID=H8FN62_MAGML|nr:hypothetical protein PHAMO_10225 [Magnetospirillum molischianum DSM 120]